MDKTNIIIIIIIIVVVAIELSLGGSSPYTSTDKQIRNNIHK
jgi:flagellar basal body-associated protein FliL